MIFVSRFQQLCRQLQRLSPPPTPSFEHGYIFPLDKDYAMLEACGLLTGLAAAITSVTTGNAPGPAVVTGFIIGCGTGLLAIAMLRIEWDMGPFAELRDDVP